MSQVGYYRESEVQDAMAVVASWMGRDFGLKVVYHEGTAVDADIFNKVIRIPKLVCSGGLTQEGLMLTRGRVYHEAGHIAFTKLDRADYPSGIVHEIYNAVEDRREERETAENYPGAGPTFRWMMEYHNKKIAEMAAEGRINGAIWESLVAMSFQSEGIRPLWRLSEKAQRYFDAAYDKFCEWKYLGNGKAGARAGVKLAEEIYEIMKDAHEEYKKEQEQQQQEQQEQEEQESGESQESSEESESQESEESGESEESHEDDDDGEGNGEGSGGESEEDDESEESEGGESGEGSGDDEESEEESEGSGGESEEEGEEEGEPSAGSGSDFDDEEEDEGQPSAGSGSDFDDEEEGEEEGVGEGEDGESGDGDVAQDGSESDDSEGGDGEYDPSDEGDIDREEGGEESEEERDEAAIEQEMEEELGGPSLEELAAEDIEKALEEIDPADAAYLSRRDLDEHNVIEGSDYDKGLFKQEREEISTVVATMTASLVQALRARTKCRKDAYKRHGRLDNRRLVQIAKGLSKEVFYKTRKGEKIDTAVSIVIDESCSMRSKYRETRLAAIAIGEALSQVGIPFEVTGTTTKYIGSSTRIQPLNGLDRTNPLVYNHYKTFDQNWMQVKHGIVNTGFHNHNVDGEAIEYVARRLAGRPEARKIVFSLSDGLPDAGHCNYAVMGKNIVRTCERARKQGIEVYGLGIKTRDPEMFYGKENFIYVQDVAEDLSKAFVNIVGNGVLNV